MWLKYALKGQKLLTQGSALGIVTVSNAPCKGKSFINFRVSFKAFALTGRQVCVRNNPGRCPGLRASALSGRAAYQSFDTSGRVGQTCGSSIIYKGTRAKIRNADKEDVEECRRVSFITWPNEALRYTLMKRFVTL